MLNTNRVKLDVIKYSDSEIYVKEYYFSGNQYDRSVIFIDLNVKW